MDIHAWLGSATDNDECTLNIPFKRLVVITTDNCRCMAILATYIIELHEHLWFSYQVLGENGEIHVYTSMT